MKVVSIKSVLLDKYRRVDPEMLEKHGRPCLLVMRLKYKGMRRMFAVPFRSNIVGSSPKNQYFPLPPRPSTKSGNRHGLHYIKMFPVSKKFFEQFKMDNAHSAICLAKIDDNEKLIVEQCQLYLQKYEQGERPPYATAIDILLAELDKMEK